MKIQPDSRGLDPRIHPTSRDGFAKKRWMAGSSPATTADYIAAQTRT
jgi:hypothetical protein